MARDAAKAQPWKVDGKAWHLSQKSLSPRQPPQWKPMTLVELIGRMVKARPDARPDWARKSAVCLLDKQERLLGRVITHDRHGLRVEICTPAGAYSPTRIDGLGLQPRIDRRKGFDWVIFVVQSLEQVDAARLAGLLKDAVGAVSQAD